MHQFAGVWLFQSQPHPRPRPKLGAGRKKQGLSQKYIETAPSDFKGDVIQ